MKPNRFRCVFLPAALCLGVLLPFAAVADSELSAQWQESPAYQRMLPLDTLKSLMVPAEDLPVPPGVTGPWNKGLPLIQPGEEAVLDGHAFVRRSSIQMHNLETADGKSQMLNLRVFVLTDFDTSYPLDSAETAQYFREVRPVDIGRDGRLMITTLPGGRKSASVAFHLGEVGFTATAVTEGEVDGVPLALGAARAWVKHVQSATGPARNALDKAVELAAAPARAPAAPEVIQASGPDLLADLKEAAELGVVNAQMRLAEIYQDGAEGVPADPAQAAFWLHKAAEQGNAMAQRGLGTYYDFGVGVEQDQAEAVRWYTLAAEQGDLPATFNLGVSYQRGEGVAVDPVEAYRWFRRAADAGMPQAQYKVGSFYDAGLGVETDKDLAAAWYRKAAEQGMAAAQNDLGVGYLRGEGVEQDGAEAVAWFAKAADQGYPMAMFNLGMCYLNGAGVDPDGAEARAWLQRAAQAGYQQAADVLLQLE